MKKAIALILTLALFASIGISAYAEPPDVSADSTYKILGTFVTNVKTETDSEAFISNFTNGESITLFGRDDNEQYGFIGTGSYMKLSGNKYTVVIAGDINGNGCIDANDCLLIKLYLRGLFPMTSPERIASDTDRGGSITTTDYLRIKGSLAGKFKLTSDPGYTEPADDNEPEDGYTKRY